MVSSRRRRVFLKEHQVCCFCGQLADTIDHMPPRVFFTDRIWPEEFEFPSCSNCQKQTKLDEAIAALYIVVGDHSNFSEEEIVARFESVRNNAPNALPEAALSANTKRRALKSMGYDRPILSDTYQEVPMISYPKRARQAFERVAAKLTLAMHYRISKTIASNDQYCVAMNWVYGNKRYNEQFANLATQLPKLHRGTRRNTDLLRSFTTKEGYKAENNLSMYVAEIGKPHTFCGIITNISKETNHEHFKSVKYIRTKIREPLKEEITNLKK